MRSCPTYRLTPVEGLSPRGRLQLAGALLERRLAPGMRLEHLLDTCLLCRACEDVCPNGVPITETIARALGRRKVPFLVRALLTLTARPAALAVLEPDSLARTAVEAARRLPGRAFRAAADLVPPWDPGPSLLSRPRRSGRVAVFRGCVARILLRGTERRLLRLLEAVGLAAYVPPGQGCCGALHLHAGREEEARRLARRNLRALLAGDPEAIVTTAGGCAAMLREYPRLLAGDAAAARLAEKVVDVSQLLAGRLPPPRRPAPAATYQDSCHLAHVLRVRTEPRALLAAATGGEFRELPGHEICCGSAGFYNLVYPEAAFRLGREKVERAAALGVRLLVTTNPGCTLHLARVARALGSPVRVVHLVDLLYEAHLPATSSG